MKRTGVPIEPQHAYASAFLSPDGAWFAVPSFMLKQSPGADVYSVADGQRYVVTVGEAYGSCDNIDFAGPGQVLTLRQIANANGSAVLVQICDIKTARKSVVLRPRPIRTVSTAPSAPAGAYLALVSRLYDRVLLYDLTDGTLAGQLRLPPKAQTLGLSFAPDGKSFAALVQTGGESRLLNWELTTGKRIADLKLDSTRCPKSRSTRVKPWSGSPMVRVGSCTDKLSSIRTGRSPNGFRQWLTTGARVGCSARTRWPSSRGRSVVGPHACGVQVSGRWFWKLIADHTAPPPQVAQVPKEVEKPRVVRQPKRPAPSAKPKITPEEEAIQKLGGYITRDLTLPGSPVVGITLYSNKVTDADLSYLKPFPQLKRLQLGQGKITDKAFDQIKQLTQLQALSLSGCQDITDKGIAHLAALSKLQTLSLGGCKKITDEGFKVLAKLSNLQDLDLSYTSITNDGVAALKGLKNLRKLSLNATKVSDPALAHLEGLTEMRNLDLFNVGEFGTGKRVTDAGMAYLKGMTKLQVLLIPNTNVTGKGMAHVRGMTGAARVERLLHPHRGCRTGRVERSDQTGAAYPDRVEVHGRRPGRHRRSDAVADLNIGFSDLSDKGMVHLKNLTNLTSLDLSQSKVGDAGLVHLAKLTKLSNLSLSSTKVTDAGFKHLAANKGLFTLWLSGPTITDEGMKALKDFPRLGSLYLHGTKVTEAGVQDLKKSLPRIQVSRNSARSQRLPELRQRNAGLSEHHPPCGFKTA